MKRVLIVCLILAVFIVPWTIRNYYHFNDFVPVTYGAANPLMEGTYQYEFPEIFDDSIPEARFREKFGHYYDENGQLKDPEVQEYLNSMLYKEQAKYRIKTWMNYDLGSFLKTYFVMKPRLILNWAWYWSDFGYEIIQMLRRINCLFCIFTVILAFVVKRFRFAVSYLTISYIINLLMICTSLAIDRYAQMIMPYRYLIAGIGIYLVADILYSIFKKKGLKPNAG